jgi:hypothetical protein
LGLWQRDLNHEFVPVFLYITDASN